MVIISPKHKKLFQNQILTWYEYNQRALPWRIDRDPYHILVSEVMLQQTQVTRVIPKYLAWLLAFPTLNRLACAPTAEVLTHWSGLGYNRRALFLKKFAEAVTTQYRGVVPEDIGVLKTLPGIGDYTSRAIACFAYDTQIPVLDTNIRKVIAVHFFNGSLPDDKTILRVAEQLLPNGKAYEWNQALMDYASAQLKKEKIPISKQSHFLTSNRYFRGQILKYIIRKQSATKNEIAELFKGRSSKKESVFIESIIKGLVKDKLIILKQDRLTLP